MRQHEEQLPQASSANGCSKNKAAENDGDNPDSDSDVLDEEELDAADLEFVDDDPEGGGSHSDVDGEDADADDGEDAELAGGQPRPLKVARDDAAATLAGHASSVFCLAASPDGRLLASGGEDDRALVWSLRSAAAQPSPSRSDSAAAGATAADLPGAADTAVLASLVGVCGGHGDSVVFAAFNKTGTMLATGDLAGRIQVWETSQFTGAAASGDAATLSQPAEAKPVWSGDVAELRWGCWHPQVASALLIGAGDGSCWLWQVPSGECKVLPSGQGPGETTCGLVLPSEPRSALVAYDNGQVRLFDLKAAAPAAGQTPLACDSAVLSLDAAPTSGLAVCGTESGQVVCFRAASPRQKLSMCSLPQVSASSATSVSAGASGAGRQQPSDNWAVESVQFCPQQETLLVAGCLAGYAFVFNLAAGGDLRVRLRCDVGDGAGVVRALWLPGPGTPRFVTADVAGRARLWDGLSGGALREWLGHRDALLDACLLPPGLPGPPGLLATCADKCDCTVKLYRID